jgi:hypothetical protein
MAIDSGQGSNELSAAGGNQFLLLNDTNDARVYVAASGRGARCYVNPLFAPRSRPAGRR